MLQEHLKAANAKGVKTLFPRVCFRQVKNESFMELLKKLCQIHAPSGNEAAMKAFIIDYVNINQKSWKVKPDIITEDIQDCVVLKFGTPRTAVFAHLDSIGFMVRYQDQLVPIGGPDAETGYRLVGEDTLGPIDCELWIDDDNMPRYKFGRAIATGTELVFKCDFRETKHYVQSCYLDNRLGVYNTLKLAETLEDGLLVFSCWEEHGGGSVPYLVKMMVEKYQIKQALVSDITWVTEGVMHGKGVAISIRDRSIPRRQFVNKIIALAEESGIDYQLEVEGTGGSDGREIHASPYPVDWCFIGAPEAEVHSPNEKVHKHDIDSMLRLYQWLLLKL